MAKKVMINCAITGAIHTPTMSPHLPIQPEDIARQAIDAAKAGAATVHVHVRDPQDGRPSTDVSLFGKVIDMIKAESDVIICTTTGGGLGMTVEERVAVVPEYKPELASCNMGSINFALFPILDKLKEFKYDWEEGYLAMTKDFIFRNTFQDLETVTSIMNEQGTKPELEIYDVAHINNAAFLLNKGFLKPPLYLQFVMGILGGIPATIENLVFLKESADRLIGKDNYVYSAFGAGRNEYPICTASVLLGGHCRVGLEDNLYLGKGVMAKTNAEMVEKMRRIIEEFSLEVATPDEGREMLGLK